MLAVIFVALMSWMFAVFVTFQPRYDADVQVSSNSDVYSKKVTICHGAITCRAGVGGAHLPLIGRWDRWWIFPEICDSWPVWTQTYGWLQSIAALFVGARLYNVATEARVGAASQGCTSPKGGHLVFRPEGRMSMTKSGLVCVYCLVVYVLLSCTELWIFLCRLVLFVCTLGQAIGWEDYYSRDIYRVEGFSLQRPDWRVIFCNGLLCVFPTRNIVSFLLNFTFFKLQHTFQRHDIAHLCWKCR